MEKEYEPLKGKWIREEGDVYEIYGAKMDKQQLVNQDCQDLFEDIELAINWLKNRSNDFATILTDEEYKRFIKIIDEAFEDITK